MDRNIEQRITNSPVTLHPAALEAACHAVLVDSFSPAAARYQRALEAALPLALASELRKFLIIDDYRPIHYRIQKLDPQGLTKTFNSEYLAQLEVEDSRQSGDWTYPIDPD